MALVLPSPPLGLQEEVPLAPLTTLGLGGRARYFLEAPDGAALAAALGWARDEGLPAVLLAGGSNVVVADAGVDGLVVRMAQRGVRRDRGRETAEAGGDRIAAESSSGGAAIELWTVAAGEPWDPLVERAVAAGLAGIECLSGIPGTAGATPIQNVGAYGQEVSQTVCAVRALDRSQRAIATLTPAECRFAYRDSLFKSGAPGRHVVLAVTYRLVPGGPPAVRYAEVARHLETRGVPPPSLADVRAAVLAIRRAKSMVIAPGDENRRSCGSFFVNPVVAADVAASVRARAGGGLAMPCWPEPGGRAKLSAAWLIERAGFARGHRAGPVGLSSRHALAIVAHDGARARDVVAFARLVRDRVEDRFGIRLAPEPVFWGLPGLD